MKNCCWILAALLLGGCAAMNKKECKVADWRALGYQHGSQGQNTQAFNDYQKACAAHDIKADFAAFQEGHRQGLDDYCTLERGRSLGQAGAAYNAQCAAQRYPDFDLGYRQGLEGYCTYDNGFRTGEQGRALNRSCSDYPGFGAGHEEGRRRYEVARAIRSVEERLDAIDAQIIAEQNQIGDAEALILSKEATVDDRTRALVDIKHHSDEIGRLKEEHGALQAELADLYRQQEAMR